MRVAIMPKKKPTLLGKRIKKLREAKGWTQLELAIKAGLSPSNLAAVEQGQIADPRTSTTTAIASALGVDVAELLREDRPPAR
jgi:transcriptional regulator with XRE-family HTH domain